MSEYMMKGNINDEKYLSVPILYILQANGGELPREQIVELLITDGIVTEDDVNRTRVSKKTNNEWYPFRFAYNYAIKNLKESGFVDYLRSGPIKLTAKGQNCNLELVDVDKDIYDVSASYWESKRKQRQDKKSDSDMEDPSINNDDSYRQEILDKIKELEPKKFESFSRGLLRKMGIEMDPEKGVSYSNDGGIDGFGYCVDKQSLKTTRVVIQCKRWQGSVGSVEINSLRGAVDTHRAEYGVFITTSYFSRSAVESSRSGGTPITLIDGQKLVDLMIENKYKVRKIESYIPDEDYFGD